MRLMMIEQFAINIDNIQKADELRNVKQILSREKADRIERFCFEKDKIRGIVGEVLVRYLLIEKYNINNSDISFGYSDRRKPYLLSPNCRIYFNISHAGSWVVCGIGDSEIGIDVEQIKDKEIRFANYVLTTQEYNKWLSLPRDEQRNYFYQLWTIKESYSKYLGIGLALQFTDVTVDSLCYGYYSVNEKEDCVLFSQQFSKGYYLSVCVSKDKKEDIISQVTCIDINNIFKALLLN